MAAAGGISQGGGVCAGCKHEHPMGSTCTVCGHIRQPLFKAESELARPPGVYVSNAYELASAVDRPDVRGMWALERTLRSRLREEFAQYSSASLPGPPVVTSLMAPPDGDAQHESDAHDVNSRHFLGRIGDGAVTTLRWRPINTLDGGAGGGPLVALIDRLFVLPTYRRRHIARTCVLNALVDILQQGASRNLAITRVSVVVPEEPRLVPFVQLLQGLGFTPYGVRRDTDPTGMWESPDAAMAAAAAAAAGGLEAPGTTPPKRAFVELSLPIGSVLPLLQAAQAANEGVRPPAAPAAVAMMGGAQLG